MALLDPVLVRVEPRIAAQQSVLMAQSALTPRQIHDLRVTTKQMRACLRLYRPFVDADVLRHTDRMTKQIADTFAGMRDSHVQIKTLNKLLQGKPHVMLQLQPVYDALQEGKADRLQPDLTDVAHRFDAVLTCWSDQLQVDESLWWRDGAAATYRRAAKARKRAVGSQLDEDFHRWRKWTKFWFYQLTFLADLSARPARRYVASLKRLGDELGDFQDLCVLEVTLQRLAHSVEDPTLMPWLLSLVARRKLEMTADCEALGIPVFSLSDRQLTQFLEAMPGE